MGYRMKTDQKGINCRCCVSTICARNDDYPIESKTLRWKSDGMGLLPSKCVSEIVMINDKITVSMYVDIMSQNLKNSIRNLSVGRR
ncbi:hypothetical protein AVEN_205346-1 [Araneus ventricosus]|uniref:Uncharacterized protein n=1 Tax=Araneus ventricosus TaxID=182803 RepID=A0A4Y2QXJ6_ARAVE|nr:hypothetical protein AVEN_205346-1 [Araneus ventricosus]